MAKETSQFNELIKQSVDARVKWAIDEAEREAQKILKDKLNKVAAEISFDLLQSNELHGMIAKIEVKLQ